ncbi:MAG: GAF and ANTAR domain-containing protein [Pedococcus sp.]
MHHRVAILSDLAKVMATQSPALTLAGRLCASAVTILGVRGVSVTLAYTGEERVTLCSTDDVAARLEDLQEVLGQGPGRRAYSSGRQVVVDLDSEVDDRWPQFGAAAHDSLGPLRICAVPIRPDHEILGVLTAHLDHGRPLALEPQSCQFLADTLGAALLRDPHAADTDMSGPWAERAAIHQATGMVVAQLRVGVEDALALLRAHAFAAESTLAQIADDVIQRRLDFRHDDPRDGKG